MIIYVELELKLEGCKKNCKLLFVLNKVIVWRFLIPKT